MHALFRAHQTYYNIYIASILLAVIINIVLSYILVLRRRHSFTISAFILFLVSISMWAIATIVLNDSSISTYTRSLMNDLSSLGYVTIPVWLTLFSYAYVGKGTRLLRYRAMYFILCTTIFFLYMSWTTNLIKGRTSVDTFMTMWGAQTTIGPLYIVFLLWLELLLIISLITIYKDYRQTIDPLRKIQGKYIVAAILIPLTVGTLTDGILPIFHINIFPAAIPLSSIMSMLIGYAILKYGLFEMSFENLLTSMKIPIFTLGMNSSIIMMNESAISLLKLNPRSLHTVQLDKIIKDLTKRNGRQLSIKQKIKQVFLEARPAKLKGVRLIKSTGEKIDVEMHALPVISENQINAVNIVLYTGQPDKSAFEKNEIIGIASHEIKTPLASIRLIAEMLQKTASDKHDLISYEYLNKMNVQLNNMTNLINDFMDVSRIEKGKLLLQKERLNCREFLIDIVEMMQRLAGGKTITWELQPLMYIHADKNRMSQVMMNIISNAIKYSPEGTIIAVRAYREESAVCIEVEDQGDGIQKKDQANIFKSYYRTKRHAGSSTGLGMGLYISKKIITAHKGKIELESKPGKGSLFRIYLPDDT
ncbi:MAG: hypothetical protein RI947_610 [Candidatus Parcubacteria bacterium]